MNAPFQLPGAAPAPSIPALDPASAVHAAGRVRAAAAVVGAALLTAKVEGAIAVGIYDLGLETLQAESFIVS